MDKKVIDGEAYKAVEGGGGGCEGCVGDKAGNSVLCVELGMECTREEGRGMIWVLEVE